MHATITISVKLCLIRGGRSYGKVSGKANNYAENRIFCLFLAVVCRALPFFAGEMSAQLRQRAEKITRGANCPHDAASHLFYLDRAQDGATKAGD